jgi:predicted GNAT family acetyltransferase
VRQVDPAHAVDVDNHNFKLIANADNRLNVWNSLLRKLTNVNHSVLTRQDLNERTKWHYSNNSTGVLVTDLNVLSKSCNCSFGSFSVLTVRRSDNNCAVVLNIDSHTELVDHATNNRATRADNRTNLVSRNLERKHSRSELAEVISSSRDGFFHIVENLQSSNPSLL